MQKEKEKKEKVEWTYPLNKKLVKGDGGSTEPNCVVKGEEDVVKTYHR